MTQEPAETVEIEDASIPPMLTYLMLDPAKIVIGAQRTNLAPDGGVQVEESVFAEAQGKLDWCKLVDGKLVDIARPEPVPSTDPADYPLKRWEFKAMVRYLGIGDKIVAAIEKIEDPLARAVAMERYEGSDVYHRDDPLVNQLRPAVGITVKDLNAAWMQIVAARGA